MIDSKRKELPQLIVGIDSLDDGANYVHVLDAKDNVKYYCPCCHGLIKPRAYKNSSNYKVQAHFYHETGGCKEETYIHFICKNWLFKEGCEFFVNGQSYKVSNVEVEKTLHTSFGDYRPDIIVTASHGKVFYFEIASTSKKDESVIPKWDELGNDVVEVNVREFINQKYNRVVPEFKVIYSDGKCFLKSYSKREYEETVAKRKLEWKRQDKLNYKIQWERLDWFWISLAQYSSNEITKEVVLDCFKNLDYEDKLWSYHTIKNKTCVELKDEFLEIINQCFFEETSILENSYDNINIKIVHLSPFIYDVKIEKSYNYLDYKLYDWDNLRIKLKGDKILPLSCLSEIENKIVKLESDLQKINELLLQANEINNMSYVKSFSPISHWVTAQSKIDKVPFKLVFENYIHGNTFKEEIGEISSITLSQVNKQLVENEFKYFNDKRMKKLDRELMLSSLSKNSKFQNAINRLVDKINNSGYQYLLKIKYDENAVFLRQGMYALCVWKFNNRLTGFEEEVEEFFNEKIDIYLDLFKKLQFLIVDINCCKNNMWKAEFVNGSVNLYLLDPCFSENNIIAYRMVSFDYIDDFIKIDSVKRTFQNTMDVMMEYAENYKNIRFVEVN